MQYAPPPYQPYNPYVVPAMPLTAASLDATGHRPHARTMFLVAAVACALFYLGGLVLVFGGFVADASHPDPVLIVAGYATMLLGVLLLYVKLGIALYWLHGAWKWVPMEQRAGRDGKRYTPGDVFMLLVPYYNYYWQFPINLGLCDAMERVRYIARTPTTAKRDTAMWAAICEIIPFANFFVAPFFWASYMRSVDVMHEEIATALSRGP
jgi:hypothetical protein